MFTEMQTKCNSSI